MGQEQDKAAQPLPLFFRTSDELIDDWLGNIDEIAELRLPNHQPVGIIEAVAVLKTQHPHFRKWAVDNFDRRLVWSEVLQGGVSGPVLVIMQDGVALAECAPLAILSAEPNPDTLNGQAGKSERLGS